MQTTLLEPNRAGIEGWNQVWREEIQRYHIERGEIQGGKMMYWFTSDEHYGHFNIIKYCNRPFTTVEEMDETLIANHNRLIQPQDRVVHVGDFTLKNKEEAKEYIRRLKGQHTFLQGSHDYWLKLGDTPSPSEVLWSKRIDNQLVVACHYPMRTWPASHYGSWQLYGHSHGRLPPEGRQYDVGVDNNGYCPVSFEQIKAILQKEAKE